MNMQSIGQRCNWWWDGYKVSVHELEAVANKAEAVMQGYFWELGYE
ncbi:hypothetical protein ACFL2V_14345 [Pseudomonadota bacterium]